MHSPGDFHDLHIYACACVNMHCTNIIIPETRECIVLLSHIVCAEPPVYSIYLEVSRQVYTSTVN